MAEIKPAEVSAILREQLSGFKTEAQLERTSSPVRIPRNAEDLAHPEVHNLFPCGEGGGYAGGILSAALDGIRVADAIYKAV